MTAPSSADLLQRFARHGDRGAFDALVRREQGAVLRYARTVTRDAAIAEEVFQETFLAAFRSAPTFRGTSVRAWLFTILRHAAQRHGRRRSGEPAAFEELDALGAAAGWGDAPCAVLTPTPEQQALREERRRIVAAGLQKLSAADQEIVLLRDIEGLTGPEAAEVLGCTLHTAKTRLHRARLRLMAAVRATLPGGDHA